MNTVYDHKTKQLIRNKILSVTKEEDTIILLESPACLMLKQLLQKRIKNIYIPNNEEANKFPKQHKQHVYPFSLKEFCDIIDQPVTSINVVWADFNKTWKNECEQIIPLFKRQLLADNSYLIITVSLREYSKNEVLRDIVYEIQELAKPEGYEFSLMNDTMPSDNGTLTTFFKINFMDGIIRCPKCNCAKTIKNGQRLTRLEKKQRHKCLNCEFKFVLNPEKRRFPIYIREYIKETEGSLRKIAKKTEEKFGTKIHHATIQRIKTEA